MPDISASLHLLDATFFLYPSPEHAEKGACFGGTGVIIGVPVKSRPNILMTYAVTNWHVACRDGLSVIRLKSRNGEIHILDKDPSEWTFLPGKQDLAATPIRLPRPDGAPPSIVPTTLFIGHGEKSECHVGDDVFMVGRFVDFDGQETNRPATRFGTISMLDAPIRQPTNFCGHSVVVDMHSRAGFSGSPVFVYRPSFASVLTTPIKHAGVLPSIGQVPSYRTWGAGNHTEVRLLGILWGQFPEQWEINSKVAPAQGEASLVTEGSFVRGFSGMSCVIPACQISELLDHPDLKSVRDAPIGT